MSAIELTKWLVGVAVSAFVAGYAVNQYVSSTVDSRVGPMEQEQRALSKRVDELNGTATALQDYKIKDLFLHTCPAGQDPCACPPDYRHARSSDSAPITNYGVPEIASRILCVK
jgi:hypothetical protein